MSKDVSHPRLALILCQWNDKSLYCSVTNGKVRIYKSSLIPIQNQFKWPSIMDTYSSASQQISPARLTRSMLKNTFVLTPIANIQNNWNNSKCRLRSRCGILIPKSACLVMCWHAPHLYRYWRRWCASHCCIFI